MTAVGALVSFTSSTRRMLEPGIRDGVTAGWWLMPVAIAGALATVPVAAVTVFAVLTLERAGLSLALAGIVIAVASIAALGTRIWGGILIDRSGGDGMLSAAVLVFFGMLGVFAMASDTPGLVIAGTVLAFSAGWGWPGLLLVGLLRYAPNAAAKVTGRFQVGTALGAGIRPRHLHPCGRQWSGLARHRTRDSAGDSSDHSHPAHPPPPPKSDLTLRSEHEGSGWIRPTPRLGTGR